METRIISLAIAILITVSVNGQDENPNSNLNHQFGISLGGIHYQVRDDIIAPLRWDGFGIIGSFSYTIISDKGRHNIDLRVPYASVSNRYEHKGKALEGNLGYCYMRLIARNRSYGQIHLGGLIDWNYNLQFYDIWDDSHAYWLNVYELGPSIRWSKDIDDKHLLAVNFNFSLLALASRPPKYRYYDQERTNELLSKPHEQMDLTSLHEYKSFGLSCEYLYQISDKTAIGLSYLFYYKSFSRYI